MCGDLSSFVDEIPLEFALYRRAKFRVKILGKISSKRLLEKTLSYPQILLPFPRKFSFFFSLLSFTSANVNIRSREGMHDLSAVPV